MVFLDRGTHWAFKIRFNEILILIFLPSEKNELLCFCLLRYEVKSRKIARFNQKFYVIKVSPNEIVHKITIVADFL